MKIDLSQLLIVFDELLPATNEITGVYWLKALRADGIYVILAFSIYEEYVHIIIHNNLKIVPAGISLRNCSEIRVLDQKRKCLEILHYSGTGRCFLSLLEDSIVDYSE
jgi:hypothetical protein